MQDYNATKVKNSPPERGLLSLSPWCQGNTKVVSNEELTDHDASRRTPNLWQEPESAPELRGHRIMTAKLSRVMSCLTKSNGFEVTRRVFL